MNWKQHLLKVRAKWYQENNAVVRDFDVPLLPIYSDKNTNQLTKVAAACLAFK